MMHTLRRFGSQAHHKLWFHNFSAAAATDQLHNGKFHAFFAAQYGKERWQQLWSAMQQPVRHVALANPFLETIVASYSLLSTEQATPAALVQGSTARDHLPQRALSTAQKMCIDAGWKQVCPALPLYLVNGLTNAAQHNKQQQQQQPDGAHQPRTETSLPRPHSHCSSARDDVSTAGGSVIIECAADAGSLNPKPHSEPSKGDAPCELHPLYFLDLASTLPALALAPQPGMAVLDMCAAPGGKSLLLAAQLFGALQPLNTPHTDQSLERQQPAHNQHYQHNQQQQPSATANATRQQDFTEMPSLLAAEGSHLTSNDRSAPRRARLRQVLQGYVPPGLHPHITVTGHDATRWHQHHAASYDAVLLDAPCSSERHLAVRGGHIARDHWSAARSKRNAATQLALLLSAARCLKPGGRLVYSTCSISDMENDQVVSKALSRLSRERLELSVTTHDCWEGLQAAAPDLMPGLEQGREGLGLVALPDTTGWGPLYWCVLERAADLKSV